MKQIVAKFHKPLAALIIIISISLPTVLGDIGGVFDIIEYKLYDLRVNFFAASSRPSDDIVVILLDQESINWAHENPDRRWSWPWPREAYGDIVNYMNEGGARSLAFDVIFSEPSVYGNEDDQKFIEAEADYGRVVQTVFFSTQTGNVRKWPPGLNKIVFEPKDFGAFLNRFNFAKDEAGTSVQLPVQGLTGAAGILGDITGKADPDGIHRRIKLFTLFDGKAIPGLGAASLLVSQNAEKEISYKPGAKSIIWGNYTIPVNNDGNTLLRYRGSLERWPCYNAMDILRSADAWKRGDSAFMESYDYLPPENFKDAYVFFGFYAPGLYDIFSTPISSVYPGMGVHITLLDNLLQQDFIRETSAWFDVLIIIASVSLITLLVLFSNRIPLTIAVTVLLFGLLVFGCGGAYQFAGLWVPLSPPLGAAFLSFLTAALYSYATEGSQKRFIKSAFSRYLAPSVIEQIIADPSKLNLGGEKRNMTTIFTDIQRFSSISEALQNEYADDGPRVLVNLLNLYFTEMSNIVLANGGTIDKYEGDAIVAFFGAPIWTEKHAALACLSAIEMKKREKELVKDIMNPESGFYSPLSKLIDKGVIRKNRPLYTRLGINSGAMVVGNMGTPSKMDYTVMGNAVNMAARLEGVNKQYDTSGILISEYTKDIIGGEFAVRGLSRTRMVGINMPVRLYELLGLKSEAPEELLDMLDMWEKGMTAYENQDFAGAEKIFTSIMEKNKTDGVAKLYRKRCERYAATPPSAEKWDGGVDNLTEK
jgi:adenylate cyclase